MWAFRLLLVVSPLAVFAAPTKLASRGNFVAHPAVQALANVSKGLVEATEEINAFKGDPSAMARIERTGYQVLTDLNIATTSIIKGTPL